MKDVRRAQRRGKNQEGGGGCSHVSVSHVSKATKVVRQVGRREWREGWRDGGENGWQQHIDGGKNGSCDVCIFFPPLRAEEPPGGRSQGVSGHADTFGAHYYPQHGSLFLISVSFYRSNCKTHTKKKSIHH